MSLQNRVRSMLEGALLSGVFLILLFVTLYTPLGIMTAMALPVPFTIYAARHDVKKSLLMILASSLLTLFIGALPSVFSAVFAGVLGIVMGTLYRRQRKATAVFLGGTVAGLIFFLLSILASFLFFKINPIASIQTLLQESLEMSQSMLDQLGATDPKQMEMMKGLVKQITQLVPMLLIVGSAQFALINHWLSRKILNRLGTPAASFPPFRDWKWPKSVMYYYFIVLILSVFLSGSNPPEWVELVLVNLKPILDIMLIIQGLSLVFFICYHKGWGKGLPIFAVVLVFIFPPFPFILSLIAILDLGMDLRSRFISTK